MRTILILSLALTSVLAQAASRGIVDKNKTARSAQLDQSDLDSKLGLGNNVVSANIKVDIPQNKVTLTLYTQNCPKNALCMSPTQVTAVDLPVVTNDYDSCGVNVILASQDRRPVDGSLQTLVIRDNTQNLCPTKKALLETEVVYETESFTRGGVDLKTTSTFSGPEMKPVTN
jgi:hypothetical protein